MPIHEMNFKVVIRVNSTRTRAQLNDKVRTLLRQFENIAVARLTAGAPGDVTTVLPVGGRHIHQGDTARDDGVEVVSP